jgi:hypothetical protein
LGKPIDAGLCWPPSHCPLRRHPRQRCTHGHLPIGWPRLTSREAIAKWKMQFMFALTILWLL